VLERCFQRFEETGRWPGLEQLQHDFAREDREVDVAAAAGSLPPELGFVEQQKLVLRVRALSYLPAADPLLAIWCAALKLACEKWLKEGEAARFTKADVLELAGGDIAMADRVGRLLLRERWPFGSGYGGPDDDWSCEVISAVLAARHAKGADDVLAARARFEMPSSDSDQEGVVSFTLRLHAARVRWFRRLARTIRHPLGATVIGGLVVAFLIWTLPNAANWAFSDGGGGSGSASPDPGSTAGGTEGSERESEAVPQQIRRLVAPVVACPNQRKAEAPNRVQVRAMVCMINFARRASALAPLSAPEVLDRAAGYKAAEILRCSEFSHESCGRPFTYWMKRFGYLSGCPSAGENIAFGTGRYGSPGEIFLMWMESSGHRSNILGPYDEVGVGLRIGKLEGETAHVWTQEFTRLKCEEGKSRSQA